MIYTNPKQAAMKLLITTADKYNIAPKHAIEYTKQVCDNIIDSAKTTTFPGVLEHQTKYWNQVKYWLDRKDLTAF